MIPTALVPLCVYRPPRKGPATGITFLDAPSLGVCHNRRIYRPHVVKKIARRGKTSVGWFYGFKRHLGGNDGGELVAFQVTPGHTDARNPGPSLVKGLTGKLFGDRGYLSHQRVEPLVEQDLPLITPLRQDLQNTRLPVADKRL